MNNNSTMIKLLLVSFLISISVVSVSDCGILIVDDFENRSFVNSLGKNSNAWVNNPADKTLWVKPEFTRESRGYSLKLVYDIDSAITYLASPTYLMDYSEYTILGQADRIPHTGYGGYYFLTGDIDISGFKYLVFFARGDEENGYTRRFKIELKTKNRSSSYIVDGVTNKWKRFVIPLSVFDGLVSMKNIMELTIVLNENVTDKKGVLYFDDIYFATDPYEGPGMFGRQASDPRLSDTKTDQSVFMTGDVSMNYRYTPERENEIFHAEGLTLQGQTGRVTGRINASFDSQEYGESAYSEDSDEYPYSELKTDTSNIVLKTVQLNIERLDPMVNKLTLGHIWIGYSPYNIAPAWGWKGVSIKGRKGMFEHDTFLIKRQYSSFSLGNRSLYYAGDHRLKVTALYDKKTAKLDTSSQSGGSLSGDDAWTIKPVSSEYSYLVSALMRFLNYRVNCELTYGYYNFEQKAEADYSTAKYPVYSHAVSSPAVNDSMYEAKLLLDGISRGTNICISYRDIGRYFRPEFRMEPVVFEDVYADKEVYGIRLKQWYDQYNINLYWDDFVRKSNSAYSGNTVNFGVGYLGSRNMELTLNSEIKEEKYKNSELSIDRDERVESIILAFQYSLIYPLTPGVRYPLTPKITFREDRISHGSTGSSYITHSMQIDVSYRVETDFGFSISYKTTRYGDPSWEPQGSPYDDNNLNMYFNMRF
ncbi:MAG: hypothetical protein ABIH89_01875 [Elusimicrobiota bacterium]